MASNPGNYTFRMPNKGFGSFVLFLILLNRKFLLNIPTSDECHTKDITRNFMHIFLRP